MRINLEIDTNKSDLLNSFSTGFGKGLYLGYLMLLYIPVASLLSSLVLFYTWEKEILNLLSDTEI
jgi:hypothetical protein